MFCTNCGKEIEAGARFCSGCGTGVVSVQQEEQNSGIELTPEVPFAEVQSPTQVVGSSQVCPSVPQLPIQNSSSGEKSFMRTALLSMIPGVCGLHRFYTGHVLSGLVQFFTCGLYMIWSAIDVLRILTNSFTDKNGRKLKGYKKSKAVLLFFIWLFLYGLFFSAVANSSTEADSKQSEKAATPSVVSVEENAVPATATEKTADTPPAQTENTVTTPVVTAEKSAAPEASSEKTADTAPAQIEKTAENTPKLLPSIKKVEQTYEAPIMDGAIFPYPETKQGLRDAGFSKTLRKLGLENIKRANKLMPVAAKKAAQNKKCDAVMTADLSLERSSKDNLVFFVWAKNNTKFYFTEAELMEDGPVLSEQEKLAPLLLRHEVMAEEVIKSQLNYPSTYDRHELGVFRSRTTPSCNEITIEFSARNAFNLELTYIATVQFDKNSKIVGFHMQEKR